MVKGLDLFKQHFESFQEKYILIGDTACMLVMEEAGISIDDSITLPLPIKSDLREFFQLIDKDPIDLKVLGLKNTTYNKVLNNLKAIYNISL